MYIRSEGGLENFLGVAYFMYVSVCASCPSPSDKTWQENDGNLRFVRLDSSSLRTLALTTSLMYVAVLRICFLTRPVMYVPLASLVLTQFEIFLHFLLIFCVLSSHKNNPRSTVASNILPRSLTDENSPSEINRVPSFPAQMILRLCLDPLGPRLPDLARKKVLAEFSPVTL